MFARMTDDGKWIRWKWIIEIGASSLEDNLGFGIWQTDLQIVFEFHSPNSRSPITALHLCGCRGYPRLSHDLHATFTSLSRDLPEICTI